MPIGYEVRRWDVEQVKNGRDIYTVVDSLPNEVRLGAVPSDHSVGVGRQEQGMNPPGSTIPAPNAPAAPRGATRTPDNDMMTTKETLVLPPSSSVAPRWLPM